MAQALNYPRCRDCRWWDEDQPRIEPYPGFEDTWRVCYLLSAEEIPSPARTDGSEIVTSPDFGCVQFEAREQRDPNVTFKAGFTAEEFAGGLRRAFSCLPSAHDLFGPKR